MLCILYIHKRYSLSWRKSIGHHTPGNHPSFLWQPSSSSYHYHRTGSCHQLKWCAASLRKQKLLLLYHRLNTYHSCYWNPRYSCNCWSFFNLDLDLDLVPTPETWFSTHSRYNSNMTVTCSRLCLSIVLYTSSIYNPKQLSDPSRLSTSYFLWNCDCV